MKKFITLLIAALVLTCAAQDNRSSSGSEFKEIEAVREFYGKGQFDKAGSLLDILVKDKNKKLAAEAWELKVELFSDVFCPPDYTPAILKEFSSFAKKAGNDPKINNIKSTIDRHSEEFKNNLKSSDGKILLIFGDSCIVNYAPDSTFYFYFDHNFTGADKTEHNIRIGFSGKLKNYQPYGDMQDEWGSTGLIIETDGNVLVQLDEQPVFSYNTPLNVKQYPEYVLRPVTKYGFTQEQTFIREDDSKAVSRLAFRIGDKMIVSDLNIEFLFGKMHELVPYYTDTQERIFPEKFSSKAFVELKLNYISE